ncbi:PAS domain S-box protein [Sphingomonas yunnanensis]|uniref:PAS domain S-box protein n=1 Tax=Sphingomonas yunnanensis TaxID=310400 RepID=UPI003CCE78D6
MAGGGEQALVGDLLLALREREDHYRTSVEMARHISWTADASGAILTVSARWEEITGISRARARPRLDRGAQPARRAAHPARPAARARHRRGGRVRLPAAHALR